MNEYIFFVAVLSIQYFHHLLVSDEPSSARTSSAKNTVVRET